MFYKVACFHILMLDTGFNVKIKVNAYATSRQLKTLCICIHTSVYVRVTNSNERKISFLFGESVQNHCY